MLRVDLLALTATTTLRRMVHIALVHAYSKRRARPWTAMLAVPLAITAGLMLQQWWTLIPLCCCAWWWADRTWPWTWIVAVESGAFGTLWSFSGASALAQFPEHRLIVSTIWIGFALSLAAVSAYNRSQNGDRRDYP